MPTAEQRSSKGRGWEFDSPVGYMAKEKILSVTLADCRVDYFRAGGKGGQKQNKTNSGVRVVHPPSGAVGEGRDQRSQLANKRAAFSRMAHSDKFQT